jgi:hypothetical protein
VDAGEETRRWFPAVERSAFIEYDDGLVKLERLSGLDLSAWLKPPD